MVLRQGSVLSAAEVAVGLLAIAATRGLRRGVFPGEGTVDVITYAVVVLSVIAVTIFAAYIPACRAASVNPVEAPRAE